MGAGFNPHHQLEYTGTDIGQMFDPLPYASPHCCVCPQVYSALVSMKVTLNSFIHPSFLPFFLPQLYDLIWPLDLRDFTESHSRPVQKKLLLYYNAPAALFPCFWTWDSQKWKLFFSKMMGCIAALALKFYPSFGWDPAKNCIGFHRIVSESYPLL